MKVSTYINNFLNQETKIDDSINDSELTFDIGSNDGVNVHAKSPNRIRFTLRR